MPIATENDIEDVCAKIREVSGEELTPKTEMELRKLACVLRRAISKHVKMARSSLCAKKAAIESREPEPDAPAEELRKT